MKRMIVLLLTLLSISINASENNEIKELIIKSYVNGAFNQLNTTAMRQGFHQDFAIYSENGEKISKYPINEWITAIEKRKTDPSFDISKYIYNYRFLNIDSIGNSATVKIEFSQNKQLIFTDFLLLLKFDSGWKIVSKVYHRH